MRNLVVVGSLKLSPAMAVFQLWQAAIVNSVALDRRRRSLPAPLGAQASQVHGNVAAPPGFSSRTVARTTGTGASGEMRSTSPQTYLSSITSPTTRTRTLFQPDSTRTTISRRPESLRVTLRRDGAADAGSEFDPLAQDVAAKNMAFLDARGIGSGTAGRCRPMQLSGYRSGRSWLRSRLKLACPPQAAQTLALFPDVEIAMTTSPGRTRRPLGARISNRSHSHWRCSQDRSVVVRAMEANAGAHGEASHQLAARCWASAALPPLPHHRLVAIQQRVSDEYGGALEDILLRLKLTIMVRCSAIASAKTPARFKEDGIRPRCTTSVRAFSEPYYGTAVD